MSTSTNHTVCSAFWKHFNVRSDNNIYPCCRYKAPVAKFDGNLENVLHLQIFEKLRQDSLNKVYNPNCEKCYLLEEIGAPSLRKKFNQNHSRDTVELEFLEIGFDNICNLTCDGCYGEFSSSWANIENPVENRRVNIRSTTTITHLPKSIKKILFLGGEPLMTNRHKSLLELVLDKSVTQVEYNTNGTFLLDYKTINLLNQFKNVKFYLSIDGVGKLNESVRFGSLWASILKFIDQISELNYQLEVNTVIHLNNYYGVFELADFVKEKQLPWSINILTYPDQLSIKHLQGDLRNEYIEQLRLTDNQHYSRIIKYLEMCN